MLETECQHQGRTATVNPHLSVWKFKRPVYLNPIPDIDLCNRFGFADRDPRAHIRYKWIIQKKKIGKKRKKIDANRDLVFLKNSTKAEKRRTRGAQRMKSASFVCRLKRLLRFCVMYIVVPFKCIVQQSGINLVVLVFWLLQENRMEAAPTGGGENVYHWDQRSAETGHPAKPYIAVLTRSRLYFKMLRVKLPLYPALGCAYTAYSLVRYSPSFPLSTSSLLSFHPERKREGIPMYRR